MSKADDIMLSMVKGNQVTPDPELVKEPIQEPVNTPDVNTPDDPEPVQEPVVDTDPLVDTPEDIPEEEIIDDPVAQSADLDEDIFSSWDNSDEGDPEPTIDPNINDFSELSNAVGLEEAAENKDSFVNSLKDKFSSYEQKIKDLSDNQMPDNIPDALKEAVRVAADGGDFSAYINVSSADYSSISDVDLVANSIADHFVDTDGQVNHEELNKYLDGMSDKQIEIEANKIRNSLVQHRQSQLQQIENEAKAKRAKMIEGVKGALANFNELDNFKVMPHHKDIIARDFSQDKVIQDLFYTKGQFDPNKAVRVVFREKYGSKIINNLSNRIKNSTKKEIINKMSNAQVERPSTPPATEPVQKSGMDLWIENLKN